MREFANRPNLSSGHRVRTRWDDRIGRWIFIYKLHPWIDKWIWQIFIKFVFVTDATERDESKDSFENFCRRLGSGTWKKDYETDYVERAIARRLLGTLASKFIEETRFRNRYKHTDECRDDSSSAVRHCCIRVYLSSLSNRMSVAWSRIESRNRVVITCARHIDIRHIINGRYALIRYDDTMCIRVYLWTITMTRPTWSANATSKGRSRWIIVTCPLRSLSPLSPRSTSTERTNRLISGERLNITVFNGISIWWIVNPSCVRSRDSRRFKLTSLLRNRRPRCPRWRRVPRSATIPRVPPNSWRPCNRISKYLPRKLRRNIRRSERCVRCVMLMLRC